MADRPSRPMNRTRRDDEETDQCIQACTECAQVCLQTLSAHCLVKGKEHSNAEHVKIMLDCAEICRTSADFMSRGSDHHAIICGACSEICSACAESCESVGDDQMMRCAEVCRECAESCRGMSQEA